MTTNRNAIAHCLLILIFALCGASSTCGEDSVAAAFVGEWCNRDFDTRGVTRVHIREENEELIAHMWGRCHPEECDWGEMSVVIEEEGKVLSLIWKQSFETEMQKLTRLDDGSLELVGHAHYNDGSGREDYDSKHTFQKGLVHDWSYPVENRNRSRISPLHPCCSIGGKVRPQKSSTPFDVELGFLKRN